MKHIFYSIILLTALILNSCSLYELHPERQNEPGVIADSKAEVTESEPEETTGTYDPAAEEPKDIGEIATLYDEKQFDQALITLLEADPALLEDHANVKLLWKINNQLVTAQWYLQKSISELLKGNNEKALIQLDEVLTVYPDHKQALLLKQSLMSLPVHENRETPVAEKPLPEKENKETPSTENPLPENETATPDPVKEDLKLADYYLLTGQSYFDEGLMDSAKSSWLEGLFIVPTHQGIKDSLVKLLTIEGLQHFGQGNIKASIQKWEEGLKYNPDDTDIKNYLIKAREVETKIMSID